MFENSGNRLLAMNWWFWQFSKSTLEKIKVTRIKCINMSINYWQWCEMAINFITIFYYGTLHTTTAFFIKIWINWNTWLNSGVYSIKNGHPNRCDQTVKVPVWWTKKPLMSNVLTEYLLLFFAVLINNNNHVTYFVHSNKNQK